MGPVTGVAACACMRIAYAPVANDNGTRSDRWACVDCGAVFVRIETYNASVHAGKARVDEVEARCDALDERLNTMPEPWRVPGCACPADSKDEDRCDARWSRCNERLGYLRGLKNADRARQGRELARRLGVLAIDAVRALDSANGDEVLATETLRRRMVIR